MKRHIVFGIAMVAFAPVALLALFSSPNEYRATGLGLDGAVDCDGPLHVLLLAVPSFCVYAAGFIVFAKSPDRTRSRARWATAIACALVCLMLGLSIGFALHEYGAADYREVCGQGL